MRARDSAATPISSRISPRLGFQSARSWNADSTRWFRRNKTRISPVSILNQLSNNWFSRFVPGSPSVVKHASLWRYVLLGIVGEERERLFLKLNYFDDRCNNLFRYTPDKPVAISNMEESCEYVDTKMISWTSLNLDISCEFKVLG